MVTQATIQLLLPTINDVGLQAVGAAQFGHRRAGLPLLKDGELLLGGNAAASSALDGWISDRAERKLRRSFQSI